MSSPGDASDMIDEDVGHQGIPGRLYRLKRASTNVGVILAGLNNEPKTNMPAERALYGSETYVLFIRPTDDADRTTATRWPRYQYNWVVLHEDRVWLTSGGYFEEVETEQ